MLDAGLTVRGSQQLRQRYSREPGEAAPPGSVQGKWELFVIKLSGGVQQALDTRSRPGGDWGVISANNRPPTLEGT